MRHINSYFFQMSVFFTKYIHICVHIYLSCVEISKMVCWNGGRTIGMGTIGMRTIGMEDNWHAENWHGGQFASTFLIVSYLIQCFNK